VLLRAALLGLVFAAAGCTTGVPPEPRGVPSTTPEVQTAEWAVAWWLPRHEQKLVELAERGEVDLVMIGDSITHGWETTGAPVWDEYYADRRAFNLGFGGDRTEQVLWRLAHGAVDGISPRLVVLMIGTNNTGHRRDPPAETAAGIAAILDELERRLPATRVLLLAVFPRGADPEDELRRLNEAVNERIARFADGERVFFLDLGDTFLEPDGTLSQEVMPDLLHPSEEGYRRWAQAMEPTLERLL
jgi:lysophospholipase L1-like esterase